MKHLSSFGFVPETASDQSRKIERGTSSSVCSEQVRGDELSQMRVQRATPPEPGPSPQVPATSSSASHAEEQHSSSRVFSQPIFVRHDVGIYLH